MQKTIKLQGREALVLAVMSNSSAEVDGREISPTEARSILDTGVLPRLGVTTQTPIGAVTLEVELKTLAGSTEVERSGAWAVAVLLVPQEGMSLQVFVEGSPLSTAPILVGQRRDDAVKLKAECPTLVAAVLELGRRQAEDDAKFFAGG